MAKAQNITQLREQHLDVYESIVSGDMAPKQASEANNAFGKVINSVKTQLQYFEQRKEAPNVPFAQ
jgi:hypothetical protein